MSPVATDPVVETYVADVLDAIEEAGGVTVLAAYPVGSAATGDFDAAASDLNLVVVVDSAPKREPVVAAIGRLGCPFRALELVIYARGEQPPHFALNVNADAGGAVDKPDEPSFWFVIDAAIAQDRAVSFGDEEPWSAHFEPVAEERLREALVQSIAWSQARPVDDDFARLNAIRARHYLETGEWLSKKEAAQ
jgi:hypothetical protein